jgi:hypothetical protein
VGPDEVEAETILCDDIKRVFYAGLDGHKGVCAWQDDPDMCMWTRLTDPRCMWRQ